MHHIYIYIYIYIYIINRSIIQRFWNRANIVCHLHNGPETSWLHESYYKICRWCHRKKNDGDLEREFLNVTKWANDNKLMVNMAKTKETVFHRPNSRNYLPPAELPGIERVIFAKMLGVWLQDDLGFRKHIDYVMHICNQSTYLFTQLKRQGLPIA